MNLGKRIVRKNLVLGNILILSMLYVFIMYIMCLIIFEKKVEIQDQHHLSLNRDRDRL